MSKGDETVELLLSRFAAAHNYFGKHSLDEAYWQLEFAASVLEERGDQLALAALLAEYLLSKQPNRRRQGLCIRIYSRLGLEEAAEQVSRNLLPRTERELEEIQTLNAEFAEWLRKHGGFP